MTFAMVGCGAETPVVGAQVGACDDDDDDVLEVVVVLDCELVLFLAVVVVVVVVVEELEAVDCLELVLEEDEAVADNDGPGEAELRAQLPPDEPLRLAITLGTVSQSTPCPFQITFALECSRAYDA